MVASYVSGSGGEGSHWSGNYTVSLGTTATAGEIICVVNWCPNSLDGGEPNGTGWTLALEDTDVGGGGNSARTYWKEAVGGETSVTIDRLAGSNQSSSSTVFLIDADQIEGTPEYSFHASSTVVAPEGTASADDSVVVWVFWGGGNLTAGPDVGTHSFDGTNFEHVDLQFNTGGSGDCTVTKSFTTTETTTVVFGPASGGGDDLTGQDISSGTPTLDSPPLGQEHGLSGSNISASAPTITIATIGQEHGLSGADIDSSSPTIASPSLWQAHALSGLDIAVGTPSVSGPAVGQEHALPGADIGAGAPSIDSPTLGTDGTDALTGQDLSTGTPSINSPSLGQDHGLTSQDIAGGVPILSTAALGQNNDLTGQGIASGVPAISTPALAVGSHVLTGQDIAAGVPTIKPPALGQTHALGASDITAGVPSIVVALVGGDEIVLASVVEHSLACTGDTEHGVTLSSATHQRLKLV